MRESLVDNGELLEPLLRRLAEAMQSLTDTIGQVSDEEFKWREPDGQSIRTVLETAADDLSFLYGRLLGRARGFPPLPRLQPAEFQSIHEAAMGLQVAHRQFTDQVHDLTPVDLERTATHEEAGTFNLHQVLEMATAHYLHRAQQVERMRQAHQRTFS